MTSKYDVNNQTWFDYCTVPNCHKKIVDCPICGHKGHKTEWLDTTKVFKDEQNYPDDGLCFKTHNLISHAHFVLDKDVGRHVIHKIGESSIPKKLCHKTYQIKRKILPEHVLKILDGDNIS